MSKKIQAIRGMNDLLPKNSALWLSLEKTIFDLFITYGYQNIRTPIVEKTDTFCRAIGGDTDIVEKEMYSWKEASGESLSLRPEGTAGCARMMIEHNLPRENIQKVFYQGAMFRHERPQKGRYRQFHQVGLEIFGVFNAKADAELIMIIHALWQIIGLKNIVLEVNTLGSNEVRSAYRKILVAYFNQYRNQLNEDGLNQLKTNPFRILDSKNKAMYSLISNAPKLIDYLDKKSTQHFEQFKSYLDALNITYVINTSLVRGLDYYNRTVFEWTTTDLGTQSTICAGGRYDGLIEKMGGTPTPAVGLAIGLERLVLLLEAQSLISTKSTLSIYLIAFGKKEQIKSMQIANVLHDELPSLILYNDLTLGSFKSQFKKANKAKAHFALILGEQELNNNQISIKPLRNQGTQQTMNLEEAVKYFKENQ
ncbi:histidine--tRNA ligase [Candidatus Vesicomyidisocius sp. SY067_SCS001]|uniref:histidine--tRNA ligase n=1 Tax=Candidatus Vesicomyidisocius sp. SY067_SCS001 TaxID=2732590 RepID=UPI001681F9BA|nr:histidine--tRNA ligase [Candidatus Vesicomyosocius sp. SY067_SCS001]